QKYGTYLLTAEKPQLSSSTDLVQQAENRKTPLLIGKMILLVGSRGTGLYATATFNMMNALSHVAGIMNNFSILTTQNFQYLSPEKNNFFQSIFVIFNIKTEVGLEALREAAIKGSQDINTLYNAQAYACAAIALILGFLELKAAHQLDEYKEILMRAKHFKEFVQQQNDPLPLLTQQGETLATIDAQEEKTQGSSLVSYDGMSRIVPSAPSNGPGDRVLIIALGSNEPLPRAPNLNPSTIRTSIPKEFSFFSPLPQGQAVSLETQQQNTI
ncbi:MAG: hypothetical protein PSV35_05140, partial [bacterium]|nr:hypothetical protein [bacterium]